MTLTVASSVAAAVTFILFHSTYAISAASLRWIGDAIGSLRVQSDLRFVGFRLNRGRKVGFVVSADQRLVNKKLPVSTRNETSFNPLSPLLVHKEELELQPQMSFTNPWFGFSVVWSEKRLNDKKLRHRLAVLKLSSETRDERQTFCSFDELSASVS